MEGWAVVNHPLLLLLFGAAVLLCLFDRFVRKSRGVLTIIGAALAIIFAALLLLFGGTLWEAALFMTIYLLLNLEAKHEL